MYSTKYKGKTWGILETFLTYHKRMVGQGMVNAYKYLQSHYACFQKYLMLWTYSIHPVKLWGEEKNKYVVHITQVTWIFFQNALEKNNHKYVIICLS